jgi:phosphoenolpyruvate synthase/pyruvate phosphate dikinase
MDALLSLDATLLAASHLPERLGGKAYQQLLARADGMPVLDAIVLTTEAYPGHGAVPPIGSNAPGAAVQRILRGHGIDLSDAIKQRGWRRVAVRSSATVEDQAGASFAGSFATRLGADAQSVYDAVHEVWASANTPRVQHYMVDRGLSTEFQNMRMAVLIQPLIERPLLAGVGASYPLGRAHEPWVQVSVVKGLGSAVVEGRGATETFLIERGTWSIVEERSAIHSAHMYEFAGEIGRCIEQLEIQRGTPQDIEFAIDSHRGFILLQNRPIAPARRLVGNSS